MNLSDLRIFSSAARLPSLGAAAQALHLTPSAVSKALRRLEDSLGKPLFDRSGKQLLLNDSGRLLLARAQTLLALADHARIDLMGERAAVDGRVGGPAVLLWRHALARALDGYPQGSLRLQSLFEDEALVALARGDIDAAIVTGNVIEGRHWRDEWCIMPMGSVTLQLVAGAAHPLVQALQQGQTGAAVLRASTAEVLAHDFPCPSRSLFCGVQRARAPTAGATTSCRAPYVTGRRPATGCTI